MKNNRLKVPTVIIAIGLILAAAASLLTCMFREPAIKEQDFPFTVRYQLNGESKNLEGLYRCRFASAGEGTDPLERYYEGFHLTNPSEAHPAAYTIARKDGLELCIVTIFSDRFLMGDSDGIAFHYDPYLAVMDSDGMEYTDEETLGKFDAVITDWTYPQSVDNSFQFAGFSKLHSISMIAMLMVGISVIVACMIFVKKDRTLSYKALDKVSIILNYVIVLAAIPFAALVVWLMQIYISSDALIYQACLCVPAITAFSVAASLSLRRKGFAKSGFFIQFVGPALFALLALLESVF